MSRRSFFKSATDALFGTSSNAAPVPDTNARIPVLDLAPEIAALRPALDAAFARVLDAGTFILGEEVQAFESEVEVQWANNQVTKGRAKAILANTTKEPEKAYFIYDGKEFKKVEEKEYNEVNCEKIDKK